MTIERTDRTNINKMNVIKSHCHEIFTEDVNKIAVSCNDNKRIVIDDQIHTFVQEHINLNYNKNEL